MSGAIVALRAPSGAPSWVARGRLESASARAAFALGSCLLVGTAAGFGARTGVAALIVVLVAGVVLWRPAIGALSLVAVVPVISGLRTGLPVPGLRLSEIMIAGIATLILLAARPGQTPPWRAFDWAALGYVVANAALGWADLASRGATIDLPTASRLLGPLQFFLLYRAVLTTLTSDAQRRTAIRCLLVASLPVSALALLQQGHVAGVPGFIADITGSQAFTANTVVPRATGPFAHWHDLGGYLFVIVLFGVSILASASSRVVGRKLLIVATTLAAIAVINTVSFTPITGVVAGALLLLVPRRQRPRRLLTGLTAFAVLVAVAFAPLFEGRYQQQFAAQTPVKQIPYLPQNFNFRINVWTNEFAPVIATHLTTGYGPDLPPSLSFSYTESVYVTLLLRGGLPLLLLYAALMLSLGLDARSLRQDPDPERAAVAQLLVVVTVLVVFMQLTTNYFVNAGFPHVFWVLAALLLAGSSNASSRVRGSVRKTPTEGGVGLPTSRSGATPLQSG